MTKGEPFLAIMSAERFLVSDKMIPAAPLFTASLKKSWPSKFLPLIHTNNSPALIVLEFMDTPRNIAFSLPCNSFPFTAFRQSFALPIINAFVSLKTLWQLLDHQNFLFWRLRSDNPRDLCPQLIQDRFFLPGR